MTVSSDNIKATFIGDGSTKAFDFTYLVNAASDIHAYLIDDTVSPSVVSEILSNFSVVPATGSYPSLGGTVTYPVTGSAIDTSHRLLVKRETPKLQESSYPYGNTLNPRHVEASLDTACVQIQEIFDDARKSLRVNDAVDLSGVDTVIPSPKPGYGIVWNATGTALTETPITNAETFAQAAAGSAATAASSATMATNSAATAAGSATTAMNQAVIATAQAVAAANSAAQAAESTTSTGTVYLTSSGIWTSPIDGVIFLSGCGAGAGGSSIYACGGGGGESIKRMPINVTRGLQVAYTIGAGGLGCQNQNTSSYVSYATIGDVSGNDGGDTSFGSYITLHGGHKAVATINGSTIHYYGGDPGGDGATSGGWVHTGIIAGAYTSYNGGCGGDSLFGKGGNPGSIGLVDSRMKAGDNGCGYGAGGAGGGLLENTSAGTGVWTKAGSGTNGFLKIEW